ncbi:MAG: diacylglycerol kinase family protein [Cyanobacteria bacterium P01_F01_bin.33]
MANLSGAPRYRSQFAGSSSTVAYRECEQEKSQQGVPVVSSKPVPSQSHSWKVAETLNQSFQYAGNGVAYAFRTQRNFRIHTGATVFALSLGVGLHLSAVELAVIGVTCGLVMALELMNTSLEAAVDLTVGERYHELAKVAKDCAAGSVLISAAIAVLVAALLLLPGLWQVAASWMS